MPQKYIILETEDERVARNTGIVMGQQNGYKKGFKSASLLWILLVATILFFTLNIHFEFPFLSNMRADINQKLKIQVPQHSQYIDMVLPDGKITPKILKK